ncbi:unnamed protein product [Dovyalis caffra]|uniref:Uncharacterized protein n=1 Tax=Dovyalis caffra TaxID=77055 RepID=A0AAV1R403_9ROSI|nr:unnamed protein product [Dovyalis caffra]
MIKECTDIESFVNIERSCTYNLTREASKDFKTKYQNHHLAKLEDRDMGFSKKTQVDSGLDSEGKKWVIAGIAIRTSLKPVNTKPRPVKDCDDDEEEEFSTTPTAKEARIPERLSCPPAPRKRRPSSRCNCSGVREFFTPPDLETACKSFAGQPIFKGVDKVVRHDHQGICLKGDKGVYLIQGSLCILKQATKVPRDYDTLRKHTVKLTTNHPSPPQLAPPSSNDHFSLLIQTFVPTTPLSNPQSSSLSKPNNSALATINYNVHLPLATS